MKRQRERSKEEGRPTVIYYRYVDLAFADGVRLYLERYIVEKTTAKGVWLMLDPPVPGLGARWMRHGSNFAQITKEAAWKSYRARKEAQKRHVLVALRRVEAALAMELGDDERRVVRAYDVRFWPDPEPCRCEGTHLCSSCARQP